MAHATPPTPPTPPAPPAPTRPGDAPGAPARAAPGVLMLLLQAAWARPQGLGSHLTRYARLLQRLRAPSQAALQRQAQLTALAWGSLLITVGLGGVALMLWVLLPVPSNPQTAARAWVLLAVPLAPLALSLWAFGAARRVPPPPLWAAWAAQWQADMALLHPAAPSAAVAGPAAPPTAMDLLRATAQQGSEALLRPLARQHPWALVGGAALAGALLVGGRPWRTLLRPSLLASLGAQWALQAWVESRLAKPASSAAAGTPMPYATPTPSHSHSHSHSNSNFPTPTPSPTSQPPTHRVMPTAAPRPAADPQP